MDISKLIILFWRCIEVAVRQQEQQLELLLRLEKDTRNND